MQLAEPLWTECGLKSGISVHELMSTSKKAQKKAQTRNEWLNILLKSSKARKKPPSIGNMTQLSFQETEQIFCKKISQARTLRQRYPATKSSSLTQHPCWLADPAESWQSSDGRSTWRGTALSSHSGRLPLALLLSVNSRLHSHRS